MSCVQLNIGSPENERNFELLTIVTRNSFAFTQEKLSLAISFKVIPTR